MQGAAIMLEWIAGFLVIVALLALAGWLLRGYLSGGAVTGGFFGHRPEPRIGVSDHATIDGRRKLLLIYRDGVEHLIMTGGPIDVVIEQNIKPERRPMSEPVAAAVASPSAERLELHAQPSAGQSTLSRLRQKIQPSLDQA